MKIKNVWENVHIVQLKNEKSISHMSPHVRLVYVLSGQVDILSEDYTMTFGVGEFFIIPNFSEVKFFLAGGTSRVYLMEFSYYGSHLPDEIEIFKGDSKSKGESVNSTLSTSLSQLLKLFYLSRNTATYWEVNALYFLIISKLEKKYQVRVARQKGLLSTETLVPYLEQHLVDDLTLEQVAAQFFVSKQTLSRFFKKEFGQSFGQYIQERRFLRLEDKLASSNTPINTLVYEVGFKNLSSFNRLFKKKYQLSPKQWRIKFQRERVENSTEVDLVQFQEFQFLVEQLEKTYSFDISQTIPFQLPKQLWNFPNPLQLKNATVQQQLKELQYIFPIDVIRFPFNLTLLAFDDYEEILEFLYSESLVPYLSLRITDISSTNQFLNFVDDMVSYKGIHFLENWRLEVIIPQNQVDILSEYQRIFRRLKTYSAGCRVGIGGIHFYRDYHLVVSILEDDDFTECLDFIGIDVLPLVKQQSKYSLRENIVHFSDVKAISQELDRLLYLIKDKCSDKELILTSFNLTADFSDSINDHIYQAGYHLSFLAKNEEKFSLVGSYSLFDNSPSNHLHQEFLGLPGHITRSGILKSNLHALGFRHSMYPLLVAKDENILITTDGSGGVKVLLHHYQKMNDYYSSDQLMDLYTNQNYIFNMEGKDVQFKLTGLRNGTYRVTVQTLSATNGSGLEVLRKYTGLKTLDSRMVNFLKTQLQPTLYQREILVKKGYLLEKFTLKPFEIVLLEFDYLGSKD